jgi:hypothetical protein
MSRIIPSQGVLMINNTRRVIAAGAIVAVVATVTAAAAQAASTVATTPTQFTVQARHWSHTSVDNGRKGFSAGDVGIDADHLYQHGSRVGTAIVSCTTARVGKSADQLCEFVLTIHGAQLVAQGNVRSTKSGPGTFRLAITGGTGRYEGAAGHLSMTANNSSKLPIAVSLDN